MATFGAFQNGGRPFSKFMMSGSILLCAAITSRLGSVSSAGRHLVTSRADEHPALDIIVTRWTMR